MSRPHVWRWPLLLAVLTVFGLFAALLGQHGAWLWISWVALAVPLAAAMVAPVWNGVRRR